MQVIRPYTAARAAVLESLCAYTFAMITVPSSAPFTTHSSLTGGGGAGGLATRAPQSGGALKLNPTLPYDEANSMVMQSMDAQGMNLGHGGGPGHGGHGRVFGALGQSHMLYYNERACIRQGLSIGPCELAGTTSGMSDVLDLQIGDILVGVEVRSENFGRAGNRSRYDFQFSKFAAQGRVLWQFVRELIFKPSNTPAELRARLQQPLGSRGADDFYAYARVLLHRALDEVIAEAKSSETQDPSTSQQQQQQQSLVLSKPVDEFLRVMHDRVPDMELKTDIMAALRQHWPQKYDPQHVDCGSSRHAAAAAPAPPSFPTPAREHGVCLSAPATLLLSEPAVATAPSAECTPNQDAKGMVPTALWEVAAALDEDDEDDEKEPPPVKSPGSAWPVHWHVDDDAALLATCAAPVTSMFANTDAMEWVMSCRLTPRVSA